VGVESVGIARDRTNLSRERVKLRTLNFVHTFTRSITTKAHEKNGKSSCGHSQEVSKIFRVPIYGVHCAVIFAMAQLCCYLCFFIYNFTLYRKTSNRSPLLSLASIEDAACIRDSTSIIAVQVSKQFCLKARRETH